MDSLQLPLYVAGAAMGAAWICWRYLRLLRLHSQEFRSDVDEVLLED